MSEYKLESMEQKCLLNIFSDRRWSPDVLKNSVRSLTLLISVAVWEMCGYQRPMPLLSFSHNHKTLSFCPVRKHLMKAVCYSLSSI